MKPALATAVLAALGLVGALVPLVPLLAQTPGALPPPPAILAALARAYPDRVTLGNPLEGPTVTVAGRRFAWAEGRLLPEERRQEWKAFSPQTFYLYPAEVPAVETWSPERLKRTEELLSQRNDDQPLRDPAFFDALWGITDRASAEAAQRKVTLAGLKVTVHREVREPLARVDARLQSLRRTDKTLDTFLRGLVRVEGFNWRPIAGTRSRSNHAYGTALDLIPKTYGKTLPYWLWAQQDTPDWYLRAWKARWKPHPALVAAFEAEGFVWGGKWLLFDTIHFEYRPEIFLLSK